MRAVEFVAVSQETRTEVSEIALGWGHAIDA